MGGTRPERGRRAEPCPSRRTPPQQSRAKASRAPAPCRQRLRRRARPRSCRPAAPGWAACPTPMRPPAGASSPPQRRSARESPPADHDAAQGSGSRRAIVTVTQQRARHHAHLDPLGKRLAPLGGIRKHAAPMRVPEAPRDRVHSGPAVLGCVVRHHKHVPARRPLPGGCIHRGSKVRESTPRIPGAAEPRGGPEPEPYRTGRQNPSPGDAPRALCAARWGAGHVLCPTQKPALRLRARPGHTAV